MTKAPSPTFCILPWVHRFTNVGGEIQVCCSSEEHDNDIRHEDGRPMRAPAGLDDAAIMNSAYMRKLRLEMMAGEWPSPCKRCKVTEALGGISRRQSENIRFQRHIAPMLEATAPDGAIPVNVVSSDFRLGNTCNLACRMCNPRSSIKWVGDYGKVDHDIYISDEMYKEYKAYRWYDTGDTYSYFAKQVPTLEHVHFAGGEPLIVPRMLEFLRACVDSGHAGHIQLSYNTNLTKIPDEAKRLWPYFQSVHLYCSVDGYGELNDYIRHPSRWETLDANLRDIEANHAAYGVKEALVMCTFQAYNVLKLEELYDYLAENFRFVCPIPQLVDLHFPAFYRATVLPKDLKAYALERMQRIEAKTQARIRAGEIPEWRAGILDSLRGSMKFLTAENLELLIPQFLRSAESKDALRSQSLYEIVPELRALKLGGNGGVTGASLNSGNPPFKKSYAANASATDPS